MILQIVRAMPTHRESPCFASLQPNFTDYLCICDIDPVSNRKSQTELASTLAAEMRAAFRKLKLRLREHSGDEGLTPSQISVVLRLEKEGSVTVSSLARTEGMRPQSMSAVVTPLQHAGLVKGMPDPTDGRQTLMSLTSRCHKLLQQGRAARQDWLTTRISQKLSIQEQQKLHAALTLLTHLIED
jgi:DNA-binding MarR family transcriptional regulator